MSLFALSAGRECPADVQAKIDFASFVGEQKEAVVLRTCHRTEIYACGKPGSVWREQEHGSRLRFLQGSDAVRHLFRVAAGLESLVVGEPQILSQVRRAYRAARAAGTVGPVLSAVFDRAIFVGRRARSQTSLGALGESIGSISVREATKTFGDLVNRRGVIVGAGEAARDSARCFAYAGARLDIINRTPVRAAELAHAVGGTPRPLEEMTEVLAKSEFVVLAISGTTIAVPERPRLVLDLSSPPSAVRLGGAEVRRLEDLSPPSGPKVRRAIVEAESFVESEVSRYEARCRIA